MRGLRFQFDRVLVLVWALSNAAFGLQAAEDALAPQSAASENQEAGPGPAFAPGHAPREGDAIQAQGLWKNDLLILLNQQSALGDALQRWSKKPSFLNGKPVETLYEELAEALASSFQGLWQASQINAMSKPNLLWLAGRFAIPASEMPRFEEEWELFAGIVKVLPPALIKHKLTAWLEDMQILEAFEPKRFHSGTLVKAVSLWDSFDALSDVQRDGALPSVSTALDLCHLSFLSGKPQKIFIEKAQRFVEEAQARSLSLETLWAFIQRDPILLNMERGQIKKMLAVLVSTRTRFQALFPDLPEEMLLDWVLSTSIRRKPLESLLATQLGQNPEAPWFWSGFVRALNEGSGKNRTIFYKTLFEFLKTPGQSDVKYNYVSFYAAYAAYANSARTAIGSASLHPASEFVEALLKHSRMTWVSPERARLLSDRVKGLPGILPPEDENGGTPGPSAEQKVVLELLQKHGPASLTTAPDSKEFKEAVQALAAWSFLSPDLCERILVQSQNDWKKSSDSVGRLPVDWDACLEWMRALSPEWLARQESLADRLDFKNPKLRPRTERSLNAKDKIQMEKARLVLQEMDLRFNLEDDKARQVPYEILSAWLTGASLKPPQKVALVRSLSRILEYPEARVREALSAPKPSFNVFKKQLPPQDPEESGKTLLILEYGLKQFLKKKNNKKLEEAKTQWVQFVSERSWPNDLFQSYIRGFSYLSRIPETQREPEADYLEDWISQVSQPVRRLALELSENKDPALETDLKSQWEALLEALSLTDPILGPVLAKDFLEIFKDPEAFIKAMKPGADKADAESTQPQIPETASLEGGETETADDALVADSQEDPTEEQPETVSERTLSEWVSQWFEELVSANPFGNGAERQKQFLQHFGQTFGISSHPLTLATEGLLRLFQQDPRARALSSLEKKWRIATLLLENSKPPEDEHASGGALEFPSFFRDVLTLFLEKSRIPLPTESPSLASA